MRSIKRVTWCVSLVLLAAVSPLALAAVIQPDFNDYPVASGVPPGWLWVDPSGGGTWQIIDIGTANNPHHVLEGVSGPGTSGAASAKAGFNVDWFVENSDIQVSLRIESGRGGGIGLAQCDGTTFVGNAYYIFVGPDGYVQLIEKGPSSGQRLLGYAYFGTIDCGQWYDLRMVSTGTTFQVWFRPHSTDPWQGTQKIIEVAQDALHPGHKSYVDGYAGCYADYNPAATVLFDDFRVEATPFPPAENFSDNFENATFSLANWSQLWCTLDFPSLDGSQVARFTTGEWPGGIGLRQGQQYYTFNFTLRTSVYLDDTFYDGGVTWGFEGTGASSTNFDVALTQDSATIYLDFWEDQNHTLGAGGPGATLLGAYTEPRVPGVNWYSLQVAADYNNYYIWWWKRGDPQPGSPIITVAQDAAHPGYRLVNLGLVALWGWLNPAGCCFDDFSFTGTPAPSINTYPGTSVAVQPEDVPGMTITFDNVATEGTTSVEVSATAPGGGPGGMEFLGTFYDIDTTCVHSGQVTVSLPYDDTGMTPGYEANLKLLHWVTADQTWVGITQSVDTVNNVITGVTNSLSVFAIAGPAIAPTTLVLNSITPASVTVGSGGPVALTATLTRNDTAAGVAGATVGFSVDGNSVGTAATGGGGIATLNCDPSALAPGSHTVEASFAGQVIGGITFLASTSNTLALKCVYSFIGFLPPVDNPPVFNAGKAGRTFPVKWQLKDASGAFISSLSTVVYNPLRYRQIADNGAPIDPLPADAGTAGATVLRYDSAANQFIFNWQTSSTFAGKCFELTLDLNDGTQKAARFKFTK